MQDAMNKAKILMEALPYIQRYHGKRVIIKYGGSAMEDAELMASIASDIALMHYVGLNPVIVHGGGKEISRYMKRLGKEPKFVDGLRVTDAETMDIVKMVLVGKINREIVSLINRHGELAAGVTGEDGGLMTAVKKMPGGKDIGFVGQVEAVNTKLIDDLTAEGFVPVMATVAAGKDGESYNINADTAAAELAVALNADKLIFLTDVDGLYRDLEDEDSLISELSLDECRKMVEERAVGEGMLPKVEACISVLDGGVTRAHILNGTIPHALLLEIFTDEGIGTMITN